MYSVSLLIVSHFLCRNIRSSHDAVEPEEGWIVFYYYNRYICCLHIWYHAFLARWWLFYFCISRTDLHIYHSLSLSLSYPFHRHYIILCLAIFRDIFLPVSWSIVKYKYHVLSISLMLSQYWWILPIVLLRVFAL